MTAQTGARAAAACDYRSDGERPCGRPASLRLTSADGMVVELCLRHGTDTRQTVARRAGWRVEALSGRPGPSGAAAGGVV